MKSCPLCGAKATDGATTCFECLYNYSSMSARTSTLADQQARKERTGFSVAFSDGSGRRVVVRAKRGSLYVARRRPEGIGTGGRLGEVRWYQSGRSVVIEPMGSTDAATLNGRPLTAPAVVTAIDVVGLAGAYMSVKG